MSIQQALEWKNRIEDLYAYFDDNEVLWHSMHVQRLTMTLYTALPEVYRCKVDPVNLEIAALMHDIGKLEIPRAILYKPAKLDEAEWEIIRTHPELGARALDTIGVPSEIAKWVLYHHERIDGIGYYHLQGKDIPTASRMIAITDTYSAITMKRAYEGERTHQDAISIIREVSGTQLDEDIADVFVRIPKNSLDRCGPTIMEND